MKKFRGTTLAAMSAAVLSLSSCMSNSLPSIDFLQNRTEEDESVTYVKLGDVTTSNTYNYSIKVSTSAQIYVDGSRVAVSNSYDKGESKVGSTITVKAIATSSDFSKVPVEKTVTLDTNGKTIYIDIPKAATKTSTIEASTAKSTAKANGSINITNSAANQSLAYQAKTSASLNLTSAAISNISDDKKLGIDIENASTCDIMQKNVEYSEEFFNVMTVRSSAYGTKLNETSKLTINNSNFEAGMIFKSSAESSEKAVSTSSNIDFDINELSDFTISCQVRVQLVDSIDDNEVKGFLAVPLGNKSVTYNTKAGYTCAYVANEFINKYLTAKFGTFTDQAKQYVTISNNSDKANVPYTVAQKIYIYKVSFGSITVDVNVYGPDHLTIDTNKAEKYTVSK